MSEQLIISISGMRGIVGENLTDSIAIDYGRAFGTFLKTEAHAQPDAKLSVCIGRDSRASGPMFASAIASGLCDVGTDVVDIGLAPTPTVGIMVKHFGCAGGVVITASHNPVQYNGIKLLLGNAMAPPAEKAGKIKQAFLDKQFNLVGSDDKGSKTVFEQADAIHIEKVLSIVDPASIAAKRFEVVLDSINGAGCCITKKLFDRLGCSVSAINDEPTGLFAHTPEPTAENLTGLCLEVKSKKAAIGFAQDPDADRLAIVDENGTYIGEEYTLAMAAKHVFSNNPGSGATNLSTSRMIDDIAEQNNSKVIRTPVGEANVAGAMIENGCVIGGEGNGGIIDLRIGPIRDSLLGIVLVLQLMADTGKSVSQLVSDIGGYHMTKHKFTADAAQARKIIELAEQEFADARMDTSDGVRFDFEDGWIHIRSSNTEPVMRAIIEAENSAVAQTYIDQVMKIRDTVLG